MRWMRSLLAVAIPLTLAGCPRPVVVAPSAREIKRDIAAPTVDVAAVNLSPKEEIAALLAGEPKHGSIKNGLRIAVVPFEVMGARKKAWIGEAVSEVVSTQLSRVDGVWVLEREHLDRVVEELRGRPEAPASLAAANQKAKLLRAEYLIVGKLLPHDGAWTAVATPVRVRDGARLRAVRFEISEDNFGEVDDSATKMLAQVGVKGPAVDLGQPLSGDNLEKATKARGLLSQGNLVEALPLFDAALANPSNAWGFEADYLRLMKQLGMYEWVEERAENLLARIPRGAATACHRARVLVQGADAAKSFAQARDAVQAAASCGDQLLIAEALIVYALVVADLDHPRGIAALERASELLAPTPGHHLACLAAFRLYFQRENNGLDDQGGASKRYRELAKRCEKAGNRSYAALSLTNGSNSTWSLEESIATLKRALSLAEKVGGRRLTGVRLKLATHLRDAGQPTKADAILLAGMTARLKHIQALHGGALPDPEIRLPLDLLRRMGFAGKTSAAPAQGLAALRVKAHRKALARFLHAWAERTKRATVKGATQQAEVYDALADRLVDKDPPLHDVSAEHKRRLKEQSGTTLEALEALEAPALLASGLNPGEACGVLWSWFFAIDRDHEVALASRIVRTVRKLTDWWGNPRWRFNALRLESRLLRELGKERAALAALQSARKLIVDKPSADSLLLSDEVEILRRHNRRLAIDKARSRAQVARTWSADEWLETTYAWGYYAIGASPKDVSQARQVLVDATSVFIKKKSWQRAAEGLRLTANLLDAAAHRSGSAASVHLYQKRVVVIDKLNDPQRALLARADLVDRVAKRHWAEFGGGAQSALKRSVGLKKLLNAISSAGDALARADNERQAVRVIARLPEAVPGVGGLASRALGWAEAFRQSEEYAPLAARLYALRASTTPDHAAKKVLLRKALALYAEAGNEVAAINQLERLIRYSTSESEAIANTDECLEMAEGDRWDQSACIFGLGHHVFVQISRKVQNAAKLRRFAAMGMALRDAVDANDGPERRYEYRGLVAVLAAAAGDFTSAQLLHREIKAYHARPGGSSYEYAQHLSRFADAFQHTLPARGVALYEEFFKTPGPSENYHSQIIPRAAYMARLAGMPDKEEAFLKRGIEILDRVPTQAIRYGLYGPSRAYEDKDWKRMTEEYAKSIVLIKRLYPTYHAQLRELDFSRAIATYLGGDRDGGVRALRPLVQAIEQATVPGDGPCHDSRILEVAAGFAYAQRQCSRGDALRELAGERRLRCTHACTPAPTGKQWCDGGDDYRAPNACGELFAAEGAPFALDRLGR